MDLFENYYLNNKEEFLGNSILVNWKQKIDDFEFVDYQRKINENLEDKELTNCNENNTTERVSSCWFSSKGETYICE